MEKSYKNQNSKVVQYIIDQEGKDPEYSELPKHIDVAFGLRVWFYSAAYNSRLNAKGMWWMKRWFKTIKIELTHKNANVAKADHLFWLAKNIKTPFYISYKGKYLELFNDEDAIELIMLNGDLDQYVRIHKGARYK